MLLLLLFAIGFVCFYCAWKTKSDGKQMALFSVGVTCTLFFFITLIILPISRFDDKVFMSKMRQTQEMIDKSRMHNIMTEYERAALTSKMIEMNNDLIDRQALAETWMMGIFQHPDIKYCKKLQ